MEGSSGLRPCRGGLVLCLRSLGRGCCEKRKAGGGSTAGRPPWGTGTVLLPLPPWLVRGRDACPSSARKGQADILRRASPAGRLDRHSGSFPEQRETGGAFMGAPRQQRERAAPCVTCHTALPIAPGKGAGGVHPSPARETDRTRGSWAVHTTRGGPSSSWATGAEPELPAARTECRPPRVWLVRASSYCVLRRRRGEAI